MLKDQHILRAFDRDLESVQAMIMKMGGLVEAALADAAKALETQDEALHIAIHAGVTVNEVVFTIEDDGVGMPSEVVAKLLTAPAGKSGIGVKNVHERIRLTYGEPYGIQVRSVEDEGTCVTIRLPRRKGGGAA